MPTLRFLLADGVFAIPAGSWQRLNLTRHLTTVFLFDIVVSFKTSLPLS